MKTFFAVYGFGVTSLASLLAYSLAGPAQTMPWEGYWAAWGIIAAGLVTGFSMLALANSEAAR